MGKNIQFEERVCDLEHQNMWMTMFMHNEDSLYCMPHPLLFVLGLKAT
jgi:hypothetical protein